jgi:hypothetical protein
MNARRARRRRKKPKTRPTNPHGPLRRSIYLDRDLFVEIVALAKQEERKTSDMIRFLIRRGLRAKGGGVGDVAGGAAIRTSRQGPS